LGGALEARGIPAGERRLSAEAVGEVEAEGKVLILRRIHVTYHLRLAPDKREAARRAYDRHAEYCPVARTIGSSVAITTSLEMEDLAEDAAE
jgi:uncharacterized OsmC-like protein